jgi:hypothetical protein
MRFFAGKKDLSRQKISRRFLIITLVLQDRTNIKVVPSINTYLLLLKNTCVKNFISRSVGIFFYVTLAHINYMHI